MHTFTSTVRWGQACLTLVAGSLLISCADHRETYTETSGGYVLAMRTDPEPPEVGKAAEITAVLHYQGRSGLADCPVKFREYMADVGGPPSDDYHTMRQALTSGIYRGQSGVFSDIGKWIIDFNVKCDDATFDLKFPIYVVKPTSGS